MERPEELEDQKESSPHPEQEHPVQDAHGGSMAPGLVSDTGEQVAELPDSAS